MSSADSAKNSLWAQTAKEPAITADPFRAEQTYDLAVIGGGITGTSAALAAAQQGARVVVLEARHIGWGGSGRNGGQVIPGLKLDPSEMRMAYGEKQGAQLAAEVGANADLVFSLIERHQIACDASRSGWIQAAHAPTALTRVQQRGREWAALGAPVELLDRAALEALTGTTRYFGGWRDRRAGTLQPLAYTRGLARAAKQAGATLHEAAAVRGIRRDGTLWRLATAHGDVSAKTVILGPDGYADPLVRGLAQTLICVQSAIVATEPMPVDLRGFIMPGGICASETRRLAFYFRQSPDGRLVFGGRGAAGDKEKASFHRALVEAMHRIFPATRPLAISHRWSGQVALTLDGLPHIHEPQKQLFIGIGYNGRGVAMGTLMGSWLAGLALQGTQPPLPVTPISPIPLHRFRMPGVQAGIAWAWLRDRMGFAE